MKKIYQCFIIIFMLIIYLNVNAQPVKIGGNIMLGLPNSITQTGYGIGGIFELKITDKFSGRLSVGTHLAYFEKEGLRGNELTQNKYCGLIIYRPNNNKIGSLSNLEPYIGLGLGYFTSSYETTHNAQMVNGGYVYGANIDDTWGVCATLGVNFMPGSTFQILAELNYNYLKPNYSYQFDILGPVKVEDKINLSYAAFKLFFVLEL